MTNSLKLKAKMVESGLKNYEIANLLGVSYNALYRKVQNLNEFKGGEIEKLSVLLNIDNKDEIFFAPNVDLKSTKQNPA